MVQANAHDNAAERCHLVYGEFFYFVTTLMSITLRLPVVLALVTVMTAVSAYQTEVSHNLLAQDKSTVSVAYRFEWEVYDTALYINTGADKAQIQERLQINLSSALRDYAASVAQSALMRLAQGDDDGRTLAIAIEVNTLVAGWGVRLIDLEFYPNGLE